MPISQTLGFLGAGQMATALASGWLKAGQLEPSRILASDPYAPSREAFRTATGGKVTSNNLELARISSVIVLAVKPQVLPALLAEIRGNLRSDALVLSIAAGVKLEKLSELLPANQRVIRVMPNTPALVGCSASAYSLGATATDEDAKLVRELFEAVGIAFEVPEKLLDAVTGLSGSGPAFGYVFIEALADGGVKMGLPRDVALKLAAQTVLGAAKMVLETGLHPGQLKDAVASPGGTTIAGLHALELGAFRAAAMNAVEAATKRSQELGG